MDNFPVLAVGQTITVGRFMQTKVGHNNLLGNKSLSTTLDRASQGIRSLLNSSGEGGDTNDRAPGPPGVSGEAIIEDYDGQRNIFSISSRQGARQA